MQKQHMMPTSPYPTSMLDIPRSNNEEILRALREKRRREQEEKERLIEEFRGMSGVEPFHRVDDKAPTVIEKISQGLQQKTEQRFDQQVKNVAFDIRKLPADPTVGVEEEVGEVPDYGGKLGGFEERQLVREDVRNPEYRGILDSGLQAGEVADPSKHVLLANLKANASESSAGKEEKKQTRDWMAFLLENYKGKRRGMERFIEGVKPAMNAGEEHDIRVPFKNSEGNTIHIQTGELEGETGTKEWGEGILKRLGLLKKWKKESQPPSPAEFTDSEGADKYLYPSDIGDVRGTLHGYKDIMKLTPDRRKVLYSDKGRRIDILANATPQERRALLKEIYSPSSTTKIAFTGASYAPRFKAWLDEAEGDQKSVDDAMQSMVMVGHKFKNSELGSLLRGDKIFQMIMKLRRAGGKRSWGKEITLEKALESDPTFKFGYPQPLKDKLKAEREAIKELPNAEKFKRDAKAVIKALTVAERNFRQAYRDGSKMAVGIGVNDQNKQAGNKWLNTYENGVTILSEEDREIINMGYLMRNQLRQNEDGSYRDTGVSTILQWIEENGGEDAQPSLAAVLGPIHQFGSKKGLRIKVDTEASEEKQQAELDEQVAENVRLGGWDQSFTWMKRRFQELKAYKGGQLARKLYTHPRTSVIVPSEKIETHEAKFQLPTGAADGGLFFSNRVDGHDEYIGSGRKGNVFGKGNLISVVRDGNRRFKLSLITKEGEWPIRADGVDNSLSLPDNLTSGKIAGGRTIDNYSKDINYVMGEGIVEILGEDEDDSRKGEDGKKRNQVLIGLLGDQGVLLDYINHRSKVLKGKAPPANDFLTQGIAPKNRKAFSHIVGAGEWYKEIALRYGVTVEQLRKWNKGRMKDGEWGNEGDTLVIQ